jgi:presenilin-like A22 family membrane protease
MKHTLKITLILVLFFFVSQVVGLAITNEYLDHKTTAETGNVTWQALPYNMERPPVEESTSYIWIISAILIGTLLLYLLIKFKKVNLWKIWFFLAILLTLSVAFAAFIPQIIAFILALIFAIFKIFKPNVIMQNITEIFVYGGLAAIFVPIINIFAAFMLLILISIYDIIAVFKTKHMVSIAKFQSKTQVFAGLLIPYEKMKLKKEETSKAKKPIAMKKVRLAVLGGGDIGFPLLFAGVVMKDLMLANMELIGFLKTLIIPLCVTIALFFLLMKGKEEKFYPAMPFLSIGCIIGYLIVLVL